MYFLCFILILKVCFQLMFLKVYTVKSVLNGTWIQQKTAFSEEFFVDPRICCKSSINPPVINGNCLTHRNGNQEQYFNRKHSSCFYSF
jgi:hypothetical protein